ncbi:type II toxin-antitoxin system VapC family toxin [Rhizobium sp. NPDC090279]|uniref:type II toxin-antitoxin system VapC family toxin n=1 Tax=Rhizobium sp. NPDC090279 TaxID=3364499 RepID=UPI003839EC34
MILLGINVISEPWKPVPDGVVVAWLDDQAVKTLFISAMTIAELRFGLAAMPSGKRQTILRDRLEGDVLPHFSERIPSFDLATSQFYLELMARARVSGKTIGTVDGYIATTAAANRLATRDTSPFETAGLKVINPWLR